ncbi:hypothetical protein JN531_016800 (plasmid) [Flagellatimonas centrodinii]|uniref:hypothetical protein n=1 Tax=Flagellatimonas centrodinii TaxID=2806210 RepID=UPI001FF78E3B|nr:hypothetical protein [Flagellatimonas centrodinii]ULQ48437.1 hypothetical protein JN531_016800 [Flagellatimonas centrodinii]
MATPQHTTIATISIWRGLFATAVVLITLYLMASISIAALGLDLAFARYVMSDGIIPSLYWVPKNVGGVLQEGGLTGAGASVLVAGLNAVLWTGGAGLASFVAWTAVLLFRASRQRSAGSDYVALHELDTREVVDTPTCVLAIYDYSGSVIEEPAPEAHLWIKRAPLELEGDPDMSPPNVLQIALLEVLEAHADWSCDPAGHHAKVGLRDHSIAVAEKMVGLLPDEPLAPVVGLAHDLGKILAYQQEMGVEGKHIWVKVSRNHDHLSAHILRTIREFQALTSVDRRILSATMAYAHANNTPTVPIINEEADNRVRALVHAIRVADGLTTREDQLSARDALADPAVHAELSAALPNAIFSCNVNKAFDEKAKSEGFTCAARSYVAVQESALRARLLDLLSEDVQNALAIRAKPLPRMPHPALTPIVTVLDELGLLMKSYRDLSPTPPLFTVRSGFVNVGPCLLLSRRALAERDGARLERFGDNPFALRIGPSR